MFQEKKNLSCIQKFIRYIRQVPGFDLNPFYYKSNKFNDDSSNV